MQEKDLGRWYTLNDLFNIEELLEFNPVNHKFSTDLDVSAKLSLFGNASFNEGKHKYFYPSLRPGTDTVPTMINYENTIIPAYNKLTILITDDIFSSNKYKLNLAFADTVLFSEPKIIKDKNKLYEFSNWSNGLETKPVVIPNKTKYIKDIKIMIDYVL